MVNFRKQHLITRYLFPQQKKNDNLVSKAEQYIIHCGSAVDLLNTNAIGSSRKMNTRVNSPSQELYPRFSPSRRTILYINRACSEGSDPCGQLSFDIIAQDSVKVEVLKTFNPHSRIEKIIGFNKNGTAIYYMTEDPNSIYVDSNFTYQKSIPIGDVLEDYPDADQFFLSNGNTLLFSAINPNSDSRDVFWSRYNDEKWTEAQVFQMINTSYDESDPYLDTSLGITCFTSNRIESLGGYDIYCSILDVSSGEWSLPINLGSEINSTEDERAIDIRKDGRAAVFNRKGGEMNASWDIHFAIFKQPIQILLEKRTKIKATSEGSQ